MSEPSAAAGRPGRILAAALLLGASLRLAAALAYYDAPLSPGGDDRQYFSLARSLADGAGFSLGGAPSAYRAPLYPLFAAGVLRATGSRLPGPVRLAQALLGSLSILLVFAIGASLLSAEAGAWAALFCALHPEQALLPSSLYLECFFGATALALLWASASWLKRPSAAGGLLLGAALGASLSTRATFALWPLALLPLALLGRANLRKILPGALLAAGVTALCLSPWTLRNALRFGKLIPFESGVAGPVLWYASAGYAMVPSDEAALEPMRGMYSELPHTEWDRFSLRLAAVNIAKNPLGYALGCLARAGYLWTDAYTPYLLHDHPRLAAWMEEGDRWDRIRWLDRLLRAGLAALAAFALLGGRAGGLSAAALMLGYLNLHALGAVFPRFFAPFTPVLCLAAGAGWTLWLGRAQR